MTKKKPTGRSGTSEKTSPDKLGVEKASRKRREASRKTSQDYRTRHSQDVGVQFFQEIARGPVNVRRRQKAAESLKYFCETYFEKMFSLGWASYHLEAIEKIEGAVFNQEAFALAVPRGGGKSTLCLVAVIWAALNGHSQYPLLVLATSPAAERRLKGLKTILRKNDLLFEDYPEVIAPIRFLQNEATRARGQKFFRGVDRDRVAYGSRRSPFDRPGSPSVSTSGRYP